MSKDQFVSNGLTVEVDLTDHNEAKTEAYAGYNPMNDRAKKIMEEIKVANDTYKEKLKLLTDSKLTTQTLQLEAFEALQKSANLNEQFYVNVNKQLLNEQERLKAELKQQAYEQEKLRAELKEVYARLDECIKKYKLVNK
jgi:hypothetical protein